MADFSCTFCEFFQNSHSIEHLWTVTFKISQQTPFDSRFFLKKFHVCFLVTQCLVVAVQPCMEKILIIKKHWNLRYSQILLLAKISTHQNYMRRIEKRYHNKGSKNIINKVYTDFKLFNYHVLRMLLFNLFQPLYFI